MALVWSGVAIRYALPVLRMTSYLRIQSYDAIKWLNGEQHRFDSAAYTRADSPETAPNRGQSMISTNRFLYAVCVSWYTDCGS